MKQKILITGANGFIGRFLVEEAVSQGLEVFAGVRKNSNTTTLTGLGATIVHVDYNDPTHLVSLLKDGNFEYIIHNAGLTKSPDPQKLMDVNKGLLIRLIEGVNKAQIKVKKFTYISSFASYGPADFQSNGIVADESVPHPVTHYGKSKLAAENFLRHEQSIVPYIIIRPTAVYGPGEKDLLNVFQMVKKHINIQPALLGQKLTFIYVKDLAKLTLTATLSEHTNKAYFATDGHVYTGGALTSLIKEALNKKTLNIKIPIFLMKGMAYITEKAAGLWDDYPIFNLDKVNELKAKSWTCDVSNLVTDLNFEAEYDLSRGIPETIAWYKTNQWL
jgi:nucleoside-diphosphate-sugar epimerase